MDNKNLIYKNYFLSIKKILKRINFDFLYYIPSLYKKDLRKDKISIIKIKFNFLISLFRKNYLVDNPNYIKKSKICFISHYVGSDISDKNYDFYYGELFKKLKIKEKFYVILINHTDESLNDIQKKFGKSNIVRAYVNNDFSLFFDSLIILKIIKQYLIFFFKIKIRFKKFNLLGKLNLNFNLNLFLSSRFTFKISENIIKILKISKNLNQLVSTFEGHAYERIIFNYAKKNKIKSYGYFFSVIREYKNNIYYDFSKLYQPDVILTSGQVARKDLKLNRQFKKITILGSNKSIEKIKNFNIYKKKKINKTILVCPEGLYSETNQMFDIINNNLLNSEKFNFIFRTHPLIDVREYKKNLKNKKIMFSKNKKIENDFKKSDFIFYKGSSVCVQAVQNGLIPINFKIKKNDFSLDPLYKVNKFYVDNSRKLIEFAKMLDTNKHETRIKNQLKDIQKYSQLYFQKLNVQIIKDQFKQNIYYN